MTQHNLPYDGIWPPHEAFYLEAMLLSTTLALRAADDVREALEIGSHYPPSSAEWQISALTIMNGVQSLALHAATLSRYFWPARNTESCNSRASRLRSGLGIADSSSLHNRDLRNRIEHFDEHLDEFCRVLQAGVILPTYVGPSEPESGVPTYRFRAFYTDTGVLEILGHRCELQPVLDELQLLHDRLTACAKSGGRIP